ncbi:twin-arginine translocase TatA/TatE family subunit [Desulforhabdus amnigena]|uniref:Sec-independent protein translocase protein TatA n=1 Tax=Desulforhabdus amnigena TaxID=40218 RepID=A0A9W6D030_9BACT|nr:twin-arginine translocase TatA/TatE family subunit [Desulforhabdus amnigena]GLI32818.1 hypothetical protein DAMNIGENAA_02510 [Desulforhabdus amnigena]
MLGLGPMELVIILFLLLFFFGGKKLPQIGENLGRGISEFRRSLKGKPSNLASPGGDGTGKTDRKS